MKKLLLPCLLLFIPFIVSAQKEAPLLKDFGKKILGVTNSVRFSDNAYAVFMVDDEENSDLAAVDNKMHELWRLHIKGEAFQVGKFKGNLLAYTIGSQGKQLTITAYMVDPNAGKILSQKVVYNDKDDYKEQVIPVFNEAGNSARIVLRQSGIAKTGLFPGNNYTLTKDLSIIDIDDQLNATISKPAIPDGNFITLTFNKQGDVFYLTSQKDKTVRLTKYDAGKPGTGTAIVKDIDSRNQTGSGTMAASTSDNNVVYLGLIQENSKKDRVLTLCKFDYGANAAQVSATPFDKAQLKSLEKSFVPLYKKMPEPNMGSIDNRSVGHIEEYNDNLLVSIVGGYTGTYQIGSSSAAPNAANTASTLESFAVVIAGFDLKLQPKFEQVLPVYYQYLKFLKNSYHGDGNFYDIAASNTKHDKGAYYARIDLTTGKLVKFEMMTVDSKHLLDTDALWFNDGFLVPFTYLTGILPPHKLTLDLMQWSY